MREPLVVVERNTIGLIGLVLSLLGLLTCGLLSPLGLVTSLVGLVRAPRMWAIWGVVLGVVGTIWFFWYGATMVLGVRQTPAVRQRVETQRGDATSEFVEQLAGLIRVWHAEQGELPPDEMGQQLLAGRQDLWARTPRYRVLAADRFEIRSAGPDQQFETDDDVVYEETVAAVAGSGGQVEETP